MKRELGCGVVVIALLAAPAGAQNSSGGGKASPGAKAPEPSPKDVKKDTPAIPEAVTRGIALILAMQEGESKSEWPYEGVYRVGGQIPIGYRVGGTGIAALALVQAPGYAESAERQKAVERAADFVCDSVSHPLMNPDYDGTYDVRGWGYTYGLALLLHLKDTKLMTEGRAEKAEKAIAFFIDAV